MRKMTLLKTITFLSAFLLFQIELIISKRVLPDFGGSYLVWGSCVVFFQALLLFGYFFSYLAIKKIGIRKLLPYYLGLFLLPLLFFPGKNYPEFMHTSGLPLVFSVFFQLFKTIGPVFFVLSTISVILQEWLANSNLEERQNPYTLYAISNLGSFAALATYPFVFEFFLDLNQQFLVWRILYYFLLLLAAYSVFSIKVVDQPEKTGTFSLGGISRQEVMRWLLYSAASVIMFLSVTNIITYEVAPVPLLWIIPLSIYLAAFILNFKRKPWYPAWISDKFHLIFAWSMVWFFIVLTGQISSFFIELLGLCFFLFCLCMFCQRNLYESRPANLNLSFFYLIIAAGGFLGGIVATWVMPLISTSISEYLLGLVLIAAALAIGTGPRLLGWSNLFFISYICTALIVWPVIFKSYNIFGLIIIFSAFKICFKYLFKYPRTLFFTALLVLLLMPIINSLWTNTKDIYQHRNYYGLYRVYYKSLDGSLILMNGTTIHGAEYVEKNLENEPLAYYHKSTAVGKLLTSELGSGFKNIGIIGLGAGGLSSYASAEQEIDYFEIDPDVYYIAKNIFNFVNNSRGRINYIFGDARLTIRQMPEKKYDLLIIDAFSGDSVPVHLLTTEAIKEYRRHLTDKGIILFHISNRYLDFVPVLLSNANDLKGYALRQKNKEDYSVYLFATTWFAITWDKETYDDLVKKQGWAVYIPGKGGYIRPWSDKYSNMILIMRFSDLVNSIRYFKPFSW